ncbi:MAG: saccharopine dehydrogenase NADP-binding domain-containing protein [Pseudomonadales bacterium]
MEKAQFDILIFGASSFVGKILTTYMADHFGVDNKDFTWAIAGRSETKLKEVKDSLGDKGKGLQVVLADAADEASLTALCHQTRVVISTVGPYALYGEPLVKVCAETGTDYCDLTGEVQFIKAMLDKYEGTAKASGARIVNCCGFDSIPSDMGIYFLQRQAQEKLGRHCNNIKMRVKAMKGGASGGTIASIINISKEASKNAELRKQLANPYLICPEHHAFSTRQHSANKPEFDKDFDAWTAPFIMAVINTRVVHRSNALLDNAYGEDFKYEEAMLTGSGFKGRLSASAIVVGLGAFMLGSVVKPTRWLLENYVLPKAGEGPSPDEQLNGYYDIRFIGKTDDGQTIQCKVTGDRDPGYGSTGKILAQAAASLAMDIKKEDRAGGFWTPASIFDQRFIDRLENDAGLAFDVID